MRRDYVGKTGLEETAAGDVCGGMQMLMKGEERRPKKGEYMHL